MSFIGVPNLFFTADRHFGHEYLIKAGKRKFASVEEMNEIMIARHNEVVRKGDLVYDLGDMYQCKVDQAKEIQKRMSGNFYVIEGNHDNIARKLAKQGMFVWMRQLENITVSKPWLEERQMVVLCHYGMRTWKNSVHGSWQLYGHSHGGLPDIPNYLAFDVGVDVKEWDYYPVSIEQVIQKMRKRMPAYQEYKERSRKTDLEGEE